MPAIIQKVKGKPIVIVTYKGRITFEDAQSAFQKVAQLLDTHAKPLYRVVCFDTDIVITFDEVMMMATFSSRFIRGTATDVDVISVLCGQHPLLDIYADAMRQEAFGGIEMPIFDTLEEAILHVQDWIETDRNAPFASV